MRVWIVHICRETRRKYDGENVKIVYTLVRSRRVHEVLSGVGGSVGKTEQGRLISGVSGACDIAAHPRGQGCSVRSNVRRGTMRVRPNEK